jgi:hypothetical protein
LFVVRGEAALPFDDCIHLASPADLTMQTSALLLKCDEESLLRTSRRIFVWSSALIFRRRSPHWDEVTENVFETVVLGYEKPDHAIWNTDAVRSCPYV